MLNAILTRIRENKRLFYIGLPVCFVVLFAFLLFIPQSFESKLVITRESQQAVEVNRAITLNQPDHYDLGLARTDNAVTSRGYEVIITSPDFLHRLAQKEVQTLDGRYCGSYGDYVLSYEKKSPSEWAMKQALSVMYFVRHLFVAEDKQASGAEDAWLSKEQMMIVEKIDRQISAKIDRQSDFAIISVRTQDARVSAMVATYIEEELRETIKAYERAKMETVLEQINTQVVLAKANYEQAVSEHATDAAVKKSIYESFERQRVIYEAQTLYQPAFCTLSAPTITYHHAGMGRMKKSLFGTIVIGLLALLWVCRREVFEVVREL